MELPADVWYRQLRLEDARSEALHSLEIYENLGAAMDAKYCRDLLQWIEETMKTRSTGSSGELFETILHHTSANSRLLA